MYCLPCREQNRKRKRKPLCDREGNCEVILSWQDEETMEVYRGDPFHLLPENHLAMELYERTVSLSDMQIMRWARGAGKQAKQYERNVPTLSALQFVLDNFVYEDEEDLTILIEKIGIIHQMMLQGYMR